MKFIIVLNIFIVALICNTANAVNCKGDIKNGIVCDDPKVRCTGFPDNIIVCNDPEIFCKVDTTTTGLNCVKSQKFIAENYEKLFNNIGDKSNCTISNGWSSCINGESKLVTIKDTINCQLPRHLKSKPSK